MRNHRFGLQTQSQDEIRAAYAAECAGCGACCLPYAQLPFRIFVQPEDTQVPARFVQIGPRKAVDTEYETNRYMRTEKGPWNGKLSKCAAQKWPKCSIYANRPMACKTFDPGSPACIASREWLGLDTTLPDIMELGRS